jgi:hypothetical protein
MGDAEKIEDLSAVENIEKELGIKIFSIQNIETIFNLIKEGLDPDLRKHWLNYYDMYGTVKLG